MTHPLAVKSFELLNEGLTRFGTYAFIDKGPSEVMDVDKLVAEFRGAGANGALNAMKDMVDDAEMKEFGVVLVSTLLIEMQDWDELYEFAGEDFVAEYL